MNGFVLGEMLYEYDVMRMCCLQLMSKFRSVTASHRVCGQGSPSQRVPRDETKERREDIQVRA
jgi:hypothetical protein